MITRTTLEQRDVMTPLGRLRLRVRPGRDRTAVFWSSMFVDSTTWDACLPLLADDPRTIVLVDPPGLGSSTPLARRTDIRGAADAARHLIAQLAGPIDWVGNAFGGHVGYELAATADVASFVAVSAPPEPVPANLQRKIALLGPLLRLAGPVGPVRTAILDALLTDASCADPAIRGTVLRCMGRPTRRSLALALRSFIVDRTDVSGLLLRITAPTLFVTGDDRGDWSPEDARRSAAMCPPARVEVVRASRTLIPLEQPSAFTSVLRRFWAQHAPI